MSAAFAHLVPAFLSPRHRDKKLIFSSLPTHQWLSISSISDRGGVETSVDVPPSSVRDPATPESGASPPPPAGVRGVPGAGPSVSLCSPPSPAESRLSQRFTRCGVRSGGRRGGALTDALQRGGLERSESSAESGGGLSRPAETVDRRSGEPGRKRTHSRHALTVDRERTL